MSNARQVRVQCARRAREPHARATWLRHICAPHARATCTRHMRAPHVRAICVATRARHMRAPHVRAICAATCTFHERRARASPHECATCDFVHPSQGLHIWRAHVASAPAGHPARRGAQRCGDGRRASVRCSRAMAPLAETALTFGGRGFRNGRHTCAALERAGALRAPSRGSPAAPVAVGP